jgi:hypothetical protein
VTELARLACDPLRVAVLADRGDLVGPCPFDGEGARAHLLALSADDRPRLAAEDRLVERQPLARDERPVGDDLVAGLDVDEVADHDLLDRDLSLLAVADDGCVRGDEGREAVERPLRAQLLRDPDRRVGDDDPEEEGVLPLREREREHAHHQQDRVEDREDVGADDARRRAARRGRLGRAALGEAALGLGLG